MIKKVILLVLVFLSVAYANNETHDLIKAIKKDDYNEVKFLLKEGIALNKAYIRGYTPLIYALENENYSIAKLLLEYKANTELEFNLNGKPFSGAFEAYTSSHSRDNENEKYPRTAGKSTAIYLAIKTKNIDLIKLLIESNANLNHINLWNDTPLDYANRWKKISNDKAINDIIKLIIDSGGKISGRSRTNLR